VPGDHLWAQLGKLAASANVRFPESALSPSEHTYLPLRESVQVIRACGSLLAQQLLVVVYAHIFVHFRVRLDAASLSAIGSPSISFSPEGKLKTSSLRALSYFVGVGALSQ
jgi:hypothetical protein